MPPERPGKMVGIREAQCLAHFLYPQAAVPKHLLGVAQLELEEKAGGRLPEKALAEVGQVSRAHFCLRGQQTHGRIVAQVPEEHGDDLLTERLPVRKAAHSLTETDAREIPHDAPEQRLQQAVLHGGSVGCGLLGFSAELPQE
jgi:hypothetical protein